MTKCKETMAPPHPLEEYIKPFDKIFEKWNQHEEFRRYLEGLLLSIE